MPRPVRVPALWILIPFATGIASTQLFAIPLIPSLSAAFLGLLICVRSASRPVLWKLAACLSGIFIGHGFAFTHFPSVKTELRALPPREANFTLEIERAFGYNPEYQSVSGLATIIETPTHLAPYKNAKVYYSLDTHETEDLPIAGYSLEAKAVLRPLPRGERIQAFHHYLHFRGVSYLFTGGEHLATTAYPSTPLSIIQKSRNWIREALLNNILPHSPYSRAYLGMMLGLKSELTPEQKDLFLKNGTMHLFAISGLHIGVIAACIHYLLTVCRIPRKSIPFLSLALILAFVLLTGGMASAWRAFLMIACLYLGSLYKRQSSPLNALAVSALICLAIDPLQLFLASFQMSYATVAAILLFGVPLADRFQDKWAPFKKLPRPAWTPFHEIVYKTVRFVTSGLWVSIAAFMTSSLFGILYFNTFPILGILINLALLPIASFAIVAGFCSLICAFLFLTPVAYLFNNAAIFLISLIHKALETLAEYPHLSLTTQDPNQKFLIFTSIALLAFLAFGYSRRWAIGLPSLIVPPLAIFAIGIALAY
ncbi:MAG: ComEC/Rec2 family competence protein [Verrucomicrobiota bacterium]